MADIDNALDWVNLMRRTDGSWSIETRNMEESRLGATEMLERLSVIVLGEDGAGLAGHVDPAVAPEPGACGPDAEDWRRQRALELALNHLQSPEVVSIDHVIQHARKIESFLKGD